MIYTAIDNFYVTEDQLEDSPSRRDGISREVETQLRAYGCELIQEGGILLELPQAVPATGQVLLHRFYCKESMLKFNIKRVAWACCWLATKLEETPRRLRDLLATFVRVERRREGRPLAPLDFYGKEYAVRKQELIDVERHLLRTFGFILHVDHPHKFVLNYLNILLGADQELKQEAWNLANDSLRTTLCVRFKADTVACGIIFLAARRLKVALPEDPPWWELFRVSKADVYTVARTVHALYQMPKLAYISVYRGRHQDGGGGGGGGAKDSTPILSPAAAGTPGLSGPESELDTGSRRAGGDGDAPAISSGDRVSRDSREAAPMDTERQQEAEVRAELPPLPPPPQQNGSARDRDAAGGSGERRRRRSREREDGHRRKDDRSSRRHGDREERRRERHREGGRERERERDRSGRDRDREYRRGRDSDREDRFTR